MTGQFAAAWAAWAMTFLPALVAAAGTSAPVPIYHTIELGAPGSFATAVSAKGHVVGADPGAVRFGPRGGDRALPLLGMPAQSGARAIDDKQGIAGWADTGSDTNVYHAMYWHDGGVQDLGTLSTRIGAYSAAMAINRHGVIAGYSSIDSNVAQVHPFLHEDGVMRDLGGFAADWFTEAYGINSSGHVVGSSNYPAQPHGFLIRGGAMTDLGPDGVASAYGINDDDVVVGYGCTACEVGPAWAVVWHRKRVTILPYVHPGEDTWATATAVNSQGDVVGYSAPPRNIPATSAFLYRDGILSELDTLVDNPELMHLAQAQGINDEGEIVGVGYTADGIEHGFKLVPLAGTQRDR